MKIGLPKEIKNNENRVALTPAGVNELVKHGHTVLFEAGAGLGSGIADSEYQGAGGELLTDVQDVFDQSDLIVKVKEPIPEEYDRFKKGQSLFTYLHLAPNPQLTTALLEKEITAIAYETVQEADGSLPLLSPMSEVAGRMSIQVGATTLQKYFGGIGKLLGGVPGVAASQVVIVGGGIVGTNAAKMAIGMGAHVTILDVSKKRLAYLDDLFGNQIQTLISNDYNIAQSVKTADLLVGAVLIAGAKAPKLVTETMVKTMKAGAVIVDVAIDQGGSIETIDRATTHDNPCYEKHGVIHYSVANMPGAVPATSTFALANATLPYMLELADKGILSALNGNSALLKGLSTAYGKLTSEPVAKALGLEVTDAKSLLIEKK